MKKKDLQEMTKELFPRISVNDLIALLDQAVILDVRDEDEYDLAQRNTITMSMKLTPL